MVITPARLRFALAAAAALLAAAAAPAQSVITQWNFNGPSAGTTTPNVGAGSLATVGGTTGSFASGDASGGSSDPATPSPPDFGYGVTGFPAQTAANETAGIQFNVSTAGALNVSVSFDQRHSNSASRFVAFYYSTDGTTFTKLPVSAANASPGATPAGGNPPSTPGLFGGAGTFSAFDSTVAGAGDDWFNGRTVNLSGVAGVADNPNFAFRIVSSFGAGNQYEPSSGNNYATTGTWRFDMVTVTGAPVPEPGGVALAGVTAAGLLAGWRRRRAAA